jgi:glutathione S-transferase
MILDDAQVTTTEVKSWQGLHLLHFQASSCSQKVRIAARIKQLAFVSHPVDLSRNAHVTPWFLGINPRGVVPVLVHDGVVHVESNDILTHLDGLPSPVPSLLPTSDAEREAVAASLALENRLHMDLRTLTMGFMAPRAAVAKSDSVLARYEREGAHDPARAREVAWWRDFAANGVSDDAARASAAAYREAFAGLDERLAEGPHLLGERLSVLDVAWYISARRTQLAGYPMARHPRLAAWFERLHARPAFRREGSMGAVMERVVVPTYRAFRRAQGTSLADVLAG